MVLKISFNGRHKVYRMAGVEFGRVSFNTLLWVYCRSGMALS